MRSGPIFRFFNQLIDHCDLAVAGGYLEDSFDLPVGVVFELRAVDVVGGDDALQRRADYFHRSRGDYIEVEVVVVHFLGEEAVEQINVRLQAHALARLIKVLRAHLAKFGIVQQQVGEFAALLDEVQLGHARRLALELRLRNPEDIGEDVARVVEAQGLIKIACKYVSLLRIYSFLS